MEVEKIVVREVPVEVTKIVEKIVEVIKEVPIQIKGDTQVITKEIIKEVPIEKIVEVINNDEIIKLTNKNSELESELEKIKLTLEKFNKATYLKNSYLGSLYSE